MDNSKDAVVIFSGGQDSTTCLLQATKNYKNVHCLTFDYNQRHKAEINIAKNICNKLNIHKHKIIKLDILNELAESSLTRDIPLSGAQQGEQPNSFVPARNIFFLNIASMYAYQHNITDIITGVCQVDYSNYPDCTEKFINKQNAAIVEGMNYPIKIITPLMNYSKAQIWGLAAELNQLQFVRDETLTCYNGVKGKGCAECIACELRQQGLEEFLKTTSK